MLDLRDDILDVRDIIARIEELEPIRESGPVTMPNPDDNEADQDSLFAELATLEALMPDLAGRGEDEQWRGTWYPLTLIADSYFEDYARELAEDIGAIQPGMSWPYTYIDWERAAWELRIDYSSVEVEGVTYWTR